MKKSGFTLSEGAVHLNISTNKRKTAFTLAEVLITLGIIGIIAAITIPMMVSRYQEKVTIVKLKKIYSVLNQAFEFATMDDTVPADWLVGETEHTVEAGERIAERLKPHLNVVIDCYKTSSNSGCWPTDMKILNKSQHWSAGAGIGRQSSTFTLADGYFVGIQIYSADCSVGYATDGRTSTYVCGHVWVDTNGNAGPNTIGRDFFLFYVTNDGIIPAGMEHEIDNKNPFYKTCAGDSGAGCTAWALFNENMEYLRCSDLSWNGKLKCK